MIASVGVVVALAVTAAVLAVFGCSDTHAAAAACTPGALVVTLGPPGGAGGTLYLVVTVTNHGSSACTLRDGDLQIHWRPDEHITVYDGTTRTLTAGGSRAYQLGFSESCVATTASSSVTYKNTTASVAGTAVTTRGAGVPTTVGCTDATLEAITWPTRRTTTS